MSKEKISYEQKLETVLQYINGNISQLDGAKRNGVSLAAFQTWIRKYKSEGAEGLKSTKKNKKYTVELKEKAVKDYLTGKGSQETICMRYKISSKAQLQRWIMWYNGHKEFKEPSSAKGEIYMTKGRKTTQEERAEIVAFCIEHGKDYGLTVETYGVSYQQIYAWVRKYEEKGVEGLTDRRGKAKPESELTEEDRLRQENKILQAKIKDQEMEIALLKKLRELRGGGW